MKPIRIGQALTDWRLLGAALAPIESWAVWLAVLRAAFAEPLTATERLTFETLARRGPPTRRVRELWCIAGRRSGKSRMAGAIATILATCFDHASKLAAGEVGMILVLAASRAQAATVFNYIKGFLQSSPVLAPLIEAELATEIRLRGNIIIAVHSNSFRTVRGRTLLACVFDELGYWRDETTATPDTEVYSACLPSLATTDGMLVSISTPYRKAGLLYQKFRDCHGRDRDDVLVVRGPTVAFNPLIDPALIERARAADPEASRAEWLAEFRDDIGAFLDDAVIEQCVDHGRPVELPPRGFAYACFIDPSGGRHDKYTCCLAHREGDRVVVDVLRGRDARDPVAVTGEFVGLAKEYGCGVLVGDNYAAQWVDQAVNAAGARYQRCDLVKSALYLEALPLFTRGAISIPHVPELVRELRLLERRTARSGKDTIDHGVSGSDDFANAVAGAAWCCRARKAVPQPHLFATSVPVRGVGRQHMNAREASLYGYGGGAGWNGAACGGRVIVEHLDRRWSF